MLPALPATVLVVDDVEESRDGIEKLLTADGYQVDAARSEDEAVDRAAENSAATENSTENPAENAASDIRSTEN